MCIGQNCPSAVACLQNPVCLQGTICSISNCFSNGQPNFQCVLGCFQNDLGAALQALQAVICINNQCGKVCQGGLGPPPP